MTDNHSSKPVGIKEIAKALGISIGTVDRALHNRGGVNARTQAKVLKMAEKLNYKPNLAARNLKLNRRVRIAVHLPNEVASFFDSLRDGIRAAAASVPGVRLDLDFRSYPRLGEGDVESMERDLKAGYDGLLITPGNPTKVEPVIREFTAAGTAVVCVASDAPRSGRLTSVCVDAAVSGGIAAELLGKVVRAEGAVASITGDLSTYDHGEKFRGFAGTLATVAPHLTLLPVVETHEKTTDAYKATLDLLKRRHRPQGLYISTANSLPVFQALREQSLLGKIEIVTTDLFSELALLLDAGKIFATIYQRPFAQGKIAFETIIQHLVNGTAPETSTRLAPHIILRSNLPLFPSKLERGSDF
ncbi:LacI family DNA-binding transcriptional regulator [Silvibacterium acidisoli]|uniref:LacI family DNA-binding transcriptional regulator n=1 Tax=Acidobacteriaceae bacterium ZG23-2 TaxID=2883246 RepID=UPI00406C62A5